MNQSTDCESLFKKISAALSKKDITLEEIKQLKEQLQPIPLQLEGFKTYASLLFAYHECLAGIHDIERKFTEGEEKETACKEAIKNYAVLFKTIHNRAMDLNTSILNKKNSVQSRLAELCEEMGDILENNPEWTIPVRLTAIQYLEGALSKTTCPHKQLQLQFRLSRLYSVVNNIMDFVGVTKQDFSFGDMQGFMTCPDKYSRDECYNKAITYCLSILDSAPTAVSVNDASYWIRSDDIFQEAFDLLGKIFTTIKNCDSSLAQRLIPYIERLVLEHISPDKKVVEWCQHASAYLHPSHTEWPPNNDPNCKLLSKACLKAIAKSTYPSYQPIRQAALIALARIYFSSIDMISIEKNPSNDVNCHEEVEVIIAFIKETDAMKTDYDVAYRYGLKLIAQGDVANHQASGYIASGMKLLSTLAPQYEEAAGFIAAVDKKTEYEGPAASNLLTKAKIKVCAYQKMHGAG